MYFGIIEDCHIAYSEICLSMGLRDGSVKIRITDPFSLQFVQWNMNRFNTCDCINIVPRILNNWKGWYLEIKPSIKPSHCCSDLIVVASRKRRRQQI